MPAAAEPSIAVCVITRNGADTLPRLLDSIRPHVDEVCVLDTGSTDDTLDILDRYTAEPGVPIRVERAAWRDDYAWARNASFDMATSDYLLWSDDDDVWEGAEHLRLALSLPMVAPDVLRVRTVTVWRPDLVNFDWRIRGVRAGLGACWAEPIHETLDASIPDRALTAWAHPTRTRVVHQRVGAEGRHDHRAAVFAAPLTRRTHFHRGRHLLTEDHDLEAAAQEFTAAVERPWRRHELLMIAKAYEHLAFCRFELGDRAAAEAALVERRALQRLLMADEVWARSKVLNKRFPVLPDDPVWEYARDPRLLASERWFTPVAA